MKIQKLCIFLILFILVLFHGINNYYVLTKSSYNLGSLDIVNYMEQTVSIFDAFNNASIFKAFHEVYGRVVNYSFKPPLFFLTAAPFLLFGIDKNIMAMSNIIYLAILLFATYGIGRIFFKSQVVGLSAAFLVSVFPGLFAFSRVFLLDFALASMVTLTFYLIALNRFGSFKFSLLFGLVVGLGALTKQTYFAFLLPILACFFFKKDNLRDKKILTNFVFSIILGSFIAASYYLPQFHRNVRDCFFGMFPGNFIASLSYYLHALFNKQLLPVFSCLFIISLFFLLAKKKYPLLIMIIVPLIIFSIRNGGEFDTKFPRHILSIFPYIAVAICGFAWSLPRFRKTVLISLVLFSLLQYFILSYQDHLHKTSFPHKNVFVKVEALLFNLKDGWVERNGFVDMRDEGDWEGPASEIIGILKDRIRKDTDVHVLFIKGKQEKKIFAIVKYLSLIRRLPVNFEETKISRTEKIFYHDCDDRITKKDLEDQIIQSDLIIKEEVLPGEMSIYAEKILAVFRKNRKKFYFVKSLIFPNGFKCQVYERKSL